MSAVSTANATVAAGLGALLGGAPESSGLGSTAAPATSFGAALVRAERMLDAGGEMTIPADAGAAGSSHVAVPEEGNDGELPVDVACEGQTVPDIGLSTAPAVFATPPSTPATDPAPNLVNAEDGIPDAAEAASGAQAARAADISHRTDADARMIPVPLASATNVRVSDTQPAVPAPVVAAAPGAPPDAPDASTGPLPVSPPREAGDPDAFPVGPTATTMPKDGNARSDPPGQQGPAASATAPAVTVSPTSTPTATAPDAATPAPRAVAAQIAPAVLNIVQRPVGSHQLTMTVTPDTLGPVTVRAHIGADGEVRVELLGATDAGREALRTIVTDLRRDLAAVMPHASLALGSSTAADAGALDRGAQSSTGGTAGDHASGERGRARSDGRSTSDTPARGIPRILPTPTHAVSGGGLDIFA